MSNKKNKKTIIALALVILLFFGWGLAMILVNSLNNPMSNYLELSQTQASFMQVAYYSAYFIMAIPASLIAKKFGYKGGVIAGLFLFAVGALITFPATNLGEFSIFLISMFVIAAGSATLETNCNPYITKLGDKKNESMRLNLAQSFNGVGNVIGPLILAQFLGQTVSAGEPGFYEAKMTFLSNIQTMYLIIAACVVVILIVFILFKLPTPPGDIEVADKEEKVSCFTLIKTPYIALGVLAEFIFIGVQVCGMTFFSGFAQSQWNGLSAGDAAFYLSIMCILFTLGRFISTPLMSKFKPGNILAVYMICSAILFIVAGLGLGIVSVVALLISYLFVSIGFPTVFSLTIAGLQGSPVKTVSSALVMSIIGAAIFPLLLGIVADTLGFTYVFLFLVPGFIYIAWYGLKGCKIGLERKN